MPSDWPSFPFTYDGVTRDVFTKPAQGTQPDKPGGRGILVMHELGGITRRTVEFADSLAEDSGDHNGFDVFVPMMFGRFRQGLDLKGPLKQLNNLDGLIQTMCVRAEFRAMQSRASSPIAGWMRALSLEIGARTDGPIGVVGMCLTGALVFSMIWDPAVGAVVAAQPAVPMARGKSRSKITVSDTDFAASAIRVKRLSEGGDTRSRVQIHHFEADKICPAARVAELRDRWQAQTGTTPDVRPYPGKHHATLTENYEFAKDGDRTAREIVRSFFEKALA